MHPRTLLAIVLASAAATTAAFAQQPRLGVSVEDSADPKGAVVMEVGEGSPASAAGLRNGDVIVRMGDTEVLDISAFDRVFSKMKVGDEIAIVVVRGGEKQTLKAKLGELKAPSPEMTKRERVVPGQMRGMTAPSDKSEKAERKAAEKAQRDAEKAHAQAEKTEKKDASKRAFLGVVTQWDDEDEDLRITEVYDGTAAAKCGIQSGDVLVEIEGKSVGDAADLREAISQKRPGDPLSLKVKRDGRTVEMHATLGTPKTEMVMELPGQRGPTMVVPPVARTPWVEVAPQGGAVAGSAEVAQLREEVARLKTELSNLRAQLAEMQAAMKKSGGR